jgi:hypothetical protein
MKRSGPNSNLPPSPPDHPVFFVDRSLGGKIVPTALRVAGWAVERHDDHFPDDTADTAWIQEVGRRKWIILTADQRVRYNPPEKAALLASGTYTFLLASRKDFTGAEMAATYVAAKSAILHAIANHRPPAIFKVYQNGRVDLWLEK